MPQVTEMMPATLRTVAAAAGEGATAGEHAHNAQNSCKNCSSGSEVSALSEA